MSKKFYVVEEDMITEATKKGSKVKVRAGSGYAQGVDKLCTLKDTGNGFLVKIHSNGPSNDPIYIALDYSHAQYLLIALLTEYGAGETFPAMEVLGDEEGEQG